jgi:DNA-binding NarL/FixJ family response regulator
MPPLVRDMLEQALGDEPDMEVAGVVATTGEMVDAARSALPDVVIVGLEGRRLPAACGHLLARQPQVKVLAIEADEGTGVLYELTARRELIGPVSPADVVAQIRAGGARRLFPLAEMDA